MKILKFGGTSVGSPQRMKDVCQLITDGERKIVVLSAMSGTTNSLVEIADYIKKHNAEGASSVINKLRTLYRQHVEELYAQPENVKTICCTISSCTFTNSPHMISLINLRKKFLRKANS